MLKWLYDHKQLNKNIVRDLDNVDVLDITYIIAINDDELRVLSGDLEQIELALLHHELLHIKPEMDGIEDHDSKDFKTILDKYGVHWVSGIFNTRAEDTVTESK